MKYDKPIISLEHAIWCLEEVARRYDGEIIFDEDNFPLVEDEDGVCHTDEVLRSIGASWSHLVNPISHQAPPSFIPPGAEEPLVANNPHRGKRRPQQSLVDLLLAQILKNPNETHYSSHQTLDALLLVTASCIYRFADDHGERLRALLDQYVGELQAQVAEFDHEPSFHRD